MLSLRGQELPYARHRNMAKPRAIPVAPLMITYLRNAQNTRVKRGNEVLDRIVKTPRPGKKGKEGSRHQSRGGPVEAD